jgi:hypothetical protein
VIPNEKLKRALNIYIIRVAPFVYLTDRARRSSDDYRFFAVSMRDIEKALASKSTIDLREKLLEKYYKFLDIFSK